ncbi:MAG TPA: ABC transporter permease [Puia sp.]|jgi:putative ABC transport system permease protein|nr:ABC transporter permease [Puia sp.]
MLKNYFKTAFRNLVRNKSFTFINVLGLTIGIASCLLIFLVIEFETSFDNFHKKKNRIYRVVTQFNRAGNIDYTSGVSIPVGDALRTDFSQLEAVGTILGSGGNLVIVPDNQNGKKFKESNIFYAQPQVFDILDAKWLAGNPKTSLSDPNTVVLSKRIADKYFGDWKQAIGKIINHENKETLKVAGVIDDMPVNSDFPFQIVISFKTNQEANSTDWGSTSSDDNCLIVLAPHVSAQQISSLLPAFRKKHVKDDGSSDIKNSYLLQPLNQIHFDGNFGNYNERTFSKELITALALVGLFLLMIACVNFINLATAQAVNRSKEVGIRKVLGGNRLQLLSQFMGETFLITIFSIVLACLVARIALPYLGLLLNIPLEQGLLQVAMIILFLSAVAISVTLLSGFYPAIILSGFNPVNALKSKISSKSAGGISLRRGLVVLQFTIAQILIIGTLVVLSQMNFFQTQPMGFDKNAIVNVPVPGDSVSKSKIEIFRQELLQQSGIQNVSFSFSPPANNGDWTSEFTFNHSPKETTFEPTLKWADADYFKTYGLQFVAGRPYVQSDTVNEFVVNETLVKDLGLKNPEDILGKEISFWNRRLHSLVVGVVKDFHSNSLRDPIAAAVFACRKNNYRTIGIKIQSGKEKQVLSAVEKLWTQTFPNSMYEYQFLDEKIANFYQEESQLSKLYQIFAVIAIFISCLGLYGLVSFMAIQRIKEVGIRKVLGASVASIVYLFSKEFTILIGIAFLIATPVSYYFMHQWLDGFTFKINLGIQFFLLAFIGAILIAWITVGYKAVKAGLANPVKSLRTE